MSESLPDAGAPRLDTPSIKRRLAGLPYEGLLLLALLLIAAFPAAGTQGAVASGWPQVFFQLYLAAVVACYFSWFWTHGGQTLPMKTWRVRVVGRGGESIGASRALLRLVCASVFYLPACVAVVLVMFPHRISPFITVWLATPALATLLWAHFDTDRQFLHDRLARTRLVNAD